MQPRQTKKTNKKKSKRPIVMNSKPKNKLNPTQVKLPAINLIQKVIDQQQDLLRPNVYGLKFLETLQNPFGEGRLGYTSQGSYVPDGKGDKIPFTLYCSNQIYGGTNQKGWIIGYRPMLSYATAYAYSLFHVYGNNPLDPSNSPTTETEIAEPANAAMWNSILALFPNVKIRIHSTALRVYSTSTENNTAGYLRGGFYNVSPVTGHAPLAVNTYAGLLSGLIDEEQHSMIGKDGGMCLRTGYSDANSKFLYPPVTSAWVDAEQPMFPIIYYELGTTTYAMVECVYHGEIEAPALRIPIPIPMSEEAYDPEISEIIRFHNSSEKIVSGHSFKTIMAKAIKTGSGLYKFAKKFVKDNSSLIGLAQKYFLG